LAADDLGVRSTQTVDAATGARLARSDGSPQIRGRSPQPPPAAPPSAFSGIVRTLQRRRVALAILAVASVIAALSRHVLHLRIATFVEPPMIVCGFLLIVWAMLAARARATQIGLLDAQAVRLAHAVTGFGGRVEAWLVATLQAEELEAEALRRAVVDRHTALVAAVRAHLAGRDPHDDTVVQAMTREKERKGRHGAALLLHFGTLQREALAEAQRRGFLGEARLLALDDALVTLSTVTPIDTTPRATSPIALALTVFTTAYTALLVLGASQRLMVVATGSLAGLALITFEAFASAPITAEDDPRSSTLASIIEG